MKLVIVFLWIISLLLVSALCFWLGNLNYQHRVAKYKLVQFIWYLLKRVDDHCQDQILTVIRYYQGYKPEARIKSVDEDDGLTG